MVNIGGVPAGGVNNAKMTTGLTINQGSNDDEILTLKSSDVAHGVTAFTETDTFARHRKLSSTAGGYGITGFSETLTGLDFLAVVTTEDDTRTIGATGAIQFDVRLKASTSASFISADQNMMTIGTNGTVRYIFDSDGSAHADVEWVTYDKHDDLALINEIEYELLGVEGAGQTDRRKYLEGAGIIGQDSWHFENGKQRAMVNFSKLSMLHHGALMQMGEKHMSLAEKVEGLEVELIEAKKQLAAISA